MPTTIFSNPRLAAEFTDWPLGGSKRGRCVFNVEHHPKKGYRVTRTTTGKPKLNTYGGKAVIVDGSNGKTYILQFAGISNFITISRSDFMNASAEELGLENHAAASVFPNDINFAALAGLINSAYPS